MFCKTGLNLTPFSEKEKELSLTPREKVHKTSLIRFNK